MLSESELIDAVAKLWVDNGGDIDGLWWSLPRLSDAVKAEIEQRAEDAISS